MPACAITTRGLSPRTRGSQAVARAGWGRYGSIPAHAGEPFAPRTLGPGSVVYPRARGGAADPQWVERCQRGLSPRTRGSRSGLYSARGKAGSIPAHAGEPSTRRARGPGPRVYPRARGGAGHVEGRERLPSGLSPRTRGSPNVFPPESSGAWSIPAHAGEPVQAATARQTCGVYPRARGGAGARQAAGAARAGLSPRTRGSHEARTRSRIVSRSIPAHAGEPPGNRAKVLLLEVYPRARGGAVKRERVIERIPGLSPRTRGSHGRDGQDRPAPRSIPAHAGEPQAGVTTRRGRMVYPRARGGARRRPRSA